MGLFSKIKTSNAILRKEEELLYAAVAKEMDAGIRNDALWLKALELAGGGEQKRISEYINLRIQSLKDEIHIENELINSPEYKRQQLQIAVNKRRQEENKRIEENRQAEFVKNRKKNEDAKSATPKKSNFMAGLGTVLLLVFVFNLFSNMKSDNNERAESQKQIIQETAYHGHDISPSAIDTSALDTGSNNQILRWKTKTYNLEINIIENSNIRLRGWSVGTDLSNEPNILVNHGTYVNEDDGSNHVYTFTDGTDTYIFYHNLSVVGDAPARWFRLLKGRYTAISEVAEEY